MLEHRKYPSSLLTKDQKEEEAHNTFVSIVKGQAIPWKNTTSSMVIPTNNLSELKEEDMPIMSGMRRKINQRSLRIL